MYSTNEKITMSKTNLKGIHKHMSYTIAELTAILGVNEKTILRWIDGGLKPIAGCEKPYLIAGSELQVFIKNKDEKRKVELKPHEFFCFGCKRPGGQNGGQRSSWATR
jgi:hypothetical protein